MDQRWVPADVDYVKRWGDLVRARVDQGRRLDREHNRPDQWSGDRAARFSRLAAAVAQGTSVDQFLELVRGDVNPGSTVLDVGAGAGRHAIPLARLAAHVTAVEPSPAMRDQLQSAVEQAGIANVSIVAAGWPGAPVDPADVVICSHVAYFVEDIAPFLARLRDVTRRRFYVVLRHEQRERFAMPLFERIWHEPRCPEPTFVDLFGAACQLGLWGSARTIGYGMPLSFESFEDAVVALRRDLLNPAGAEADELIRGFLRDQLAERDGRWQLATPPAHAGVFTWDGAA